MLAAEQTEENPTWYQGTADAVQQSQQHLRSHRGREVLILSGDQLFQMDVRQLQDTHRADATLAVLPVTREQAGAFGIMKLDETGRIVHFEEKPKPDRLDQLESDVPGHGRGFLASMGISLFSRESLGQSLADEALVDFGRHVKPSTRSSPRARGPCLPWALARARW